MSIQVCKGDGWEHMVAESTISISRSGSALSVAKLKGSGGERARCKFHPRGYRGTPSILMLGVVVRAVRTWFLEIWRGAVRAPCSHPVINMVVLHNVAGGTPSFAIRQTERSFADPEMGRMQTGPQSMRSPRIPARIAWWPEQVTSKQRTRSAPWRFALVDSCSTWARMATSRHHASF